MNDNMIRINSFLHFLRDILKENPNLNLKKEIIYEWITKLDVSSEQYDIDVLSEGIFEKLEKNFPKQNRTYHNKLIVPYFCRFSNNEDKIRTVSNPIKLYIPIEFNHLYESANKILTFLNNNDIAYNAKVAREIRIDDIVVRVANEEDAKKVIDFVNSDQEIKNALLQANPFCFSYNGIALTLDANLSYHRIIVDYIYEYVMSKKKNNNLDSIDVKDFFNHVTNRYNNNFLNYSTFPEMVLPMSDQKATLAKNVMIYQDISELFIQSNNENFNEKQFFELFKKYNDTNIINNKIKNINVLLDLCLIIEIHGRKYGTLDTLNNIKEYVKTGNPAYITSEFSLREKLQIDRFRENITTFMTEYNTTIDEIYNSLAKLKLALLD